MRTYQAGAITLAILATAADDALSRLVISVCAVTMLLLDLNVERSARVDREARR